jgi:acyl transferase domain-containing protein/NADPH:quinone reductase-like Zn-dependent oxidoreductase/acyl carrier protein
VATDGTSKAEKAKTATLSAARLAVAVRRAASEAGEHAALLGAEPIAIVGMGCRFPGGANGLDAYWKLLDEGRSGIRTMPETRWLGVREKLAPHLLLGGWLDEVDRFDAEFFGIAPREAKSVDPQQRLLLEVVWEALDDAGIAPGSLSGSDAGVFAAVYANDYARLQYSDAKFAENSDGQAGIGTAHSVASGRISFLLNLRGPCLTVDTACSSSLSATHLACQALRRRECSVALVAGASLKLLPDEVHVFATWGMLSSDGKAKTFDARADGFVPGEGCGVLVLKRLSDAVAQGDRIHAVIRGTAVNHDGRSSVLTAPNGPAQEAVIRTALRDGQVDASDVSYVETHGTGTSLGDPIEVEALDAVYGTAAGEACVLGAVKTNFGHLEAAAGVAGMIKAVLVLEHEAIPRNLHFERLNPQIQLQETSRIRLATEAQAWRRVAGQARYAGVSSFGLGGTNAHVVLEEAPALPAAKSGAGMEWALPISAHTAEGLAQVARRYAALLRESGADVSAIARTAARGRDHGDFRLAVSGATAEEMAAAIDQKLETLDVSALQSRMESGAGHGGLGFVFSGQGSLWAGALDALAKASPIAEKVIGECESITQTVAGWSLRAIANDEAALRDTAKGQPVLFALEAALARVLAEWGVAAEAVAGHSVGEIAAAVTAGVLTVEEGMRLVLRRGARMGEASAGRMLSATMDAAAAEEWALQGKVEIAAVNGPRAVVFAGEVAAMETLRERLQAEAVESRWLDVEYAFHSAAMEVASRALAMDVAKEFPAGVKRERRGAMQLVSTVSGRAWQSGDGDAAYWARGIRERVRFHEAVEELGRLGCATVLEVGPHPVLLRAVGESLKGVKTLAAMRRGQGARGTLMQAAALLYEAGWNLRWEKVYPGAPGHAELPRYPWEKKRYWLSEAGTTHSRPNGPESTRLRSDSGLNGPESKANWSGQEIASPFVEGKLFAAQLDKEQTPWLAEHTFRGEAILPFTAWVEMARRAAEAAAAGEVTLRDFAVGEKLVLGSAPVALQVLAAKDGRVRVAVAQEESWREVAGGGWEKSSAAKAERADLTAWRIREGKNIDLEVVYAGLREGGLEYGPVFRGLRSLRVGEGWAFGEIDAAHVREENGVHPALLDACLQVLGPAQGGVTRLPVGLREYRLVLPSREWPRGMVSVLAELHEKGSDGEADLRIVDADGRLLAEMLGLAVRRVAAASEWQVRWEIAESAVNAAASLTVEETNLAKALRLALPDWSADGSVLLTGDFAAITEGILQAVAREREQAGSIQRIAVVTRGAQAVVPGDRVDAMQAALWGLGRTLCTEYPAMAVVLADLSADAGVADEMGSLVAWLGSAATGSGEVAIRRGRVWHPRLGPLSIQKATMGLQKTTATVLEIGTPGLLETLHEESCTAREPGSGEVQMAVRAHGLNFRDVLTAMGTYAGVVAPMGGEVAGVVVQAGPGSRFAVGDAVMAFAPASLRSLVTVADAFVSAKPAHMDWADAATVPVAFLTAQYGFAELARLQRGQSVLVHSAAGGLGQAAVALARRAGARVIATAGSEGKRAWLRQQGIADVFDSRSESFADEVLRVTDGRGVDVVLNALPLIEASFRALAVGGAFLEVGKRDIWSAERVAKARPDARYWAFDLGEVVMREPELGRAMLQEITSAMARGELQPLAKECYPMAEAEQAFRKMASGRQMGKLVLMREAGAMPRTGWLDRLRDGSVLITGGTGALGVTTARWLLAKGATQVTLISRGGGSEAALALATEFPESVRIERADVADHDEMRVVLERVRESAPLRMVIHAAGELRDGVLAQASEESLAAAMRTKVEGARILEKLTAGDELLATVYYSSLVGVVGGAGQGGYAAANAFLDGMAEDRNERGLRTLSVDWGAWGEGGMATRLSESATARAARQGFKPMHGTAALDAMENVLLSGRATVAIADMDWGRFGEQYVGSKAARFFAEFLPAAKKTEMKPAASANETKKGGLEEILAGPKPEQAERMETYVRQAARKVLGLSAGRPMPAETALQEMGLDSLMALELRNVLAQAAGRPLSATLLFDYPTIRSLSGFLIGLLMPESETKAAETKTPAAVEEMSDAEAEAMLMAELDELERKGSR